MKFDFIPRALISEVYAARLRKERIKRWIISGIVVISLLAVMAWLDSDKDELQAAHEHTVETIKASRK